MRKKAIKYSISFVLVAIVGYNSVYFEKLDAATRSASTKNFDAVTFARNFYDNELRQRLDSAVDLSTLLALLKSDPDKAFTDHSNSLAIGNVRCFLVKGHGTITSIREHQIYLKMENDPARTEVPIATEFVYGNAIRDASGLINLNDFTNTSDVNRISEEINSIVRKEILKPFLANVKTGDKVKFNGAMELNQANIDFSSMEVIPVQLLILK